MGTRTCLAHVLIVAGYLLTASQAPTAAEEPTPERIVNLGDSITDGQTYALLVEQALREAGKPVPRFFGAGIGADTAAGMLKRLDRDVLSYHATLVMLSCGINDRAHGVKAPEYEATATAIAERLKAKRVTLMILTTTNLGPAHAADEPALQEFNKALHRVAAKFEFPVAEVYDRMQKARAKGAKLWEPDGTHLNFAGYRCMARAVLDALRRRDVQVPAELKVSVLPGLIREWTILPLKEDRPALDDKKVAALTPDGSWWKYTLPETGNPASRWLDQERQRGVCVLLAENVGTAKGYLAVADVPAPRPRNAYLNTGAEVRSVWLNGRRVLARDEPYRGWHPGSYRKVVELEAGNNRIVIETGSHFFISLTDTDDWYARRFAAQEPRVNSATQGRKQLAPAAQW
jgi:lysophospholipase L1-like esterase